MSIWNEIKNTFFNEEEQKVYIDGYLTDDDSEEGKVIAKINSNTNVEYLDKRAETDEYAQEIIIETRYTILAEKAYDLYCLDWKGEHQGSCFDGCQEVCFDEFLTNEFRDDECMKYLLNDEDYILWTEILELEEIHFQKKTYGNIF